MVLVDLFMKVVAHLLQVAINRIIEQQLHFFMQRRMIVFNRQNVVTAATNDLVHDGRLATHPRGLRRW